MNECLRRLVGLSALAASLVVGAASDPVLAAIGDKPVDGLPEEVRNTLNVQYRGWRLSTIPAASLPYCNPPNLASVVSGDFDGNGEADYAVLIEHRGSGLLLAFMRYGATYRQLVVPGGGDFITLMPRGRVFHWADPDLATVNRPPPVVYFALRNDGIGAWHCESDGSVYKFKNGKFVALF